MIVLPFEAIFCPHTIMTETGKYDVIIVGAGFAGVHQLLNIRKLGLTVKIIEAGEDLAGTWLWNKYPGKRILCSAKLIMYLSLTAFLQVLASTRQWLSINTPTQISGEIGPSQNSTRIGERSKHISDMWITNLTLSGMCCSILELCLPIGTIRSIDGL